MCKKCRELGDLIERVLMGVFVWPVVFVIVTCIVSVLDVVDVIRGVFRKLRRPR